MSQANNHELLKSESGENLKGRQISITELQASLIAERDKAVAAIQRSIRAAGLIDVLSSDIRSGRVNALEANAANLKNIDPMTMTDFEALLKVAQRLKSFSQNRP